MGKHGAFGGLRGFDAFGKTMEDVKIRTNAGALITLISAAIIFTLTTVEFWDWQTVKVKPSIVVDKSRGEKLTVDMNITFPRVPCYLLSIDIMDISGEHQYDLQHDINRIRIGANGVPVSSDVMKGLEGQAAQLAKTRGANYCGDCYGGQPPESGCCNTCDEVRDSYVAKGWSFSNPDNVEQCIQEGWSEKIKAQSEEGCNVQGKVHVNKVIGNFHMSPGRSFQNNVMHMHDLVPYLQGGHHHDFGHIIHAFSFGGDGESRVDAKERARIKKELGLVNPLDGVRAHTEKSQFMFQYFLKVVGTQFNSLSGQTVNTHQYSVTSYERDLAGDSAVGLDHHGLKTAHGFMGVPGVFFNYEISPLKTVYIEHRESLAHFLTSTCAIVGGVLTVAGIIDGLLYRGQRKLKGKGGERDDVGGLGYASATGKFL